MIIDLNKVAAFTCPCCVEVTQKNLSMFDISKNSHTEFRCGSKDCNATPVLISHKGNSYTVSIQCPACLDKHTFRFSAARLIKSPSLTFKCSKTMESIAALGNKDSMADIIEELEDFAPIEGCNDLSDGNFDILYRIIDKLNDLNEQSQIRCTCDSDEIELDIRENKIVLTCVHCRNSLYIDIDENSLLKISGISSLLIK